VGGGRDVRLTVPAKERYLLEENIPTGEVVPVAGEFDLRGGPPLDDRRLDDCYRGIEGPIRIDWGRLQLDLSMDGDAAGLAPHVQVYTPPQAFCVEPQTCAPDAFNLAESGFEGGGVLVTAPGRRAEFGMTWRWRTG
jgi:galactose mutarotase-like enzyme